MRWILLFLLLAPGAAGMGLAAELPRFDFENGLAGWTSATAAGVAQIAEPPKNDKLGKGVLEYRYEAQKDQIPALMAPLNGLDGMGSFSLDLATDSPTILVVAFTEEGGARYQYVTSTPAGKWMHLDVDTSELTRADDTPDADGKLDLDQVRNVAVADLRAVLSAIAPDNIMSKLVGPRTGPHTIWMNNVAFSGKPALKAPEAGTVVIDDFRRENLAWLPFEGVGLSVGPAPGGAVGRALQVEYPLAAGKIPAFIHTVAPGAFAGLQKISFEAAAKSEATLAVSLEETGGARYIAMVTVAAGNAPAPYSVSYGDFKLTDDTKDDNNRLDMEKVKSFTLADVAGLMGAAGPQKNTLWVAGIKGSK